MRNLLGMTMREYAFTDRALLEVDAEGRRVVVVAADGTRRPIKLARWQARRTDWDRFIAALSARAFD